MISKSRIRRAALNYIYAVTESGTADALNEELFWDLCLEGEIDRVRIGTAKALLHVGRNTQDTARLLAQRLEDTVQAMQGDMTTAVLREEATRYARQSDAVDAALKALAMCLTDKRREGTEQLQLCNRDTMDAAKAALGLGDVLLPRFADFPAYRQLLERLAAVIRRRARMLGDIAAFLNPETLSGSKEHAGLLRACCELQEIRPAAEKLARGVLQHREEFDARIAPLLAHYTTERLDTVDKCILFIALYELTVNKLGTAIVIAEATKMAHEYSGGKSAPFIHGIIAAVANA